jgi:uncharacterized membrane protein YcaP (DUF421 family)
MFSLDISAIEIIARTVIVYLALLFALRLAGKRELGQMTPFDLVVLLLVSEAVQNSIIGGDESLTGGLIAAGILIGANYGLGAATERITFLREAIEGTPTLLVSNGNFLRKNMRSENLDEDEVLMAIRQHGVEDVEGVRLAVLETDGTISVVPVDAKPATRRPRKIFRKR